LTELATSPNQTGDQPYLLLSHLPKMAWPTSTRHVHCLQAPQAFALQVRYNAESLGTIMMQVDSRSWGAGCRNRCKIDPRGTHAHDTVTARGPQVPDADRCPARKGAAHLVHIIAMRTF
jgi:hypothetical protein